MYLGGAKQGLRAAIKVEGRLVVFSERTLFCFFLSVPTT